MLKKLSWFLTVALVIVMMAPAFAAPLFPDVPEQHWARDAVADLAAKGILEGYPDGTFKGDRAATRWEMAMALQRLLAKMEAADAKLASKADLEALRALVNNLKDELDALGVRVKNLEENVSAIDKRVTELERITFEGDFVTRLVTQGLYNDGRVGGVWQNVLGSNGAIAFPAFGNSGTIGAMDLFNNRPLTNGTSLTARARLGVKVKVNKDWDAKIRFAAFSSLGDQMVGAYWGVNAPYLSNPFAGNAINAQTQAANNTPWTRMTFDQFMIEHKNTDTRLTVGAIEETNFDSFILTNVPNPGIDGRVRTDYEHMSKEKKTKVSTWKYVDKGEDEELPFYGFKVSGNTHFITDGMMWEAMYSKMPDINGNGLFPGVDVMPHLFGANLGWKVKDQYAIKLNFAHISESSTMPRGTDWVRAPLMAVYGMGFWVDPAGQGAPTPMNQNNVPGAQMIGTQLQTSYGLSFNYRFDPSDIRVVLEGAGSSYKPTKVAAFNSTGYHFRGGIGWTNQKNTLDLDLEYLYTDPYYDAFQLAYSPVNGLNGLAWQLPTWSYFGAGYQLHDSDLAPNNRHGARFGGELRWNDGNGRLNVRAGWLQQAKATAPIEDIYGTYVGLKPGFTETMFPILYNAANPGTPAPEIPRGSVFHLGAGVDHKFNPSPLKGHLQYDYYNHKRNSNAAVNTLQGQWNTVNLKESVLKFGLSYAFSDKFNLRGGVDWATLSGYHPMFNNFGYNANVDVIDTRQIAPWLGFDYEVGKNTEWAVDVRYYNTKDNLAQDFNGAFTNPYSFNGLQLMTQFKVKF
ncbi:MAG: S-layer homology domain-containing protein [Vulcanimicrobiota bacterium]